MARTLSIVACNTGARGSGKTLSMVVQAAIEMLKGVTVWSNCRISFDFQYPSGKIEHFESKPLDINLLYSFDQGLRSGLVVIDEINLWADSRRSMSVGTRLLNGIFQQIRKRSLSLYLTVQNFQWLDSRIRWQTDVLCECVDLSHRYWNLEPGECIGQDLYDQSGIFTGHAAIDGHGRPVSRTLFAKRFWHIYNTDEEFDVLEAQRRVKIDADPTLVGGDFTGAYHADEQDAVLKSIATSLRRSGQSEVPVGVLLSLVEQSGIDGNLRGGLGKSLTRLGFQYHRTREGNFYRIPNLEANS